mmetsp:Transcript_101246/g.182759  ORF Transcript_101246/g.182759 Transcript_101246/m.182759 type:complete len:218 (+) Transcript_101246:242-895(+)
MTWTASTSRSTQRSTQPSRRSCWGWPTGSPVSRGRARRSSRRCGSPWGSSVRRQSGCVQCASRTPSRPRRAPRRAPRRSHKRRSQRCGRSGRQRRCSCKLSSSSYRIGRRASPRRRRQAPRRPRLERLSWASAWELFFLEPWQKALGTSTRSCCWRRRRPRSWSGNCWHAWMPRSVHASRRPHGPPPRVCSSSRTPLKVRPPWPLLGSESARQPSQS